MLIAFEGWNDAGDAASGAIDHLIEVWDGEEIAAYDPEDYYDFQVNRPIVETTDFRGVSGREIIWPTTRISVARLPHQSRDVVLVRGLEPSMRWRTFCEELLALAHDLEVTAVVSLGALLADSPHTRPIPITGTATGQLSTKRFGLEASTYEGPTGIIGVLQDACVRAEIPAASLWAAVPHYVSQPPCPKATLALINRLEDLLDLTIEQGDLPEEAKAWELGVDELAREDSEVGDYVRNLEQAKDASDLPEASGDAIARDFERYLRRRNES
ncbi:PAC2 family protein [mine drainage metagenome]|uniref:PAC2 family protein n=1 Tax=mine drainage metagenome TaxID=410659 RepID=A0A1J5Q5R6_9ZZZZ